MASTSSNKSTLGTDEYQQDILDAPTVEDKIVDTLDDLTSRSLKTRMQACETVQRFLRGHYMLEFISNRKVTIIDTVVRCLKRNKGEDLGQVAILTSLVCATIGAEPNGTFNEAITNILVPLVDPTAKPSVRSECAKSVSTCAFIIKDETLISETMHKLYDIFKNSGLKGDGKVPNIEEQISDLHGSCLRAWTLLLIAISDPKEQSKIIQESKQKVIELLESPHLDLRLTAGETIAVMYEILQTNNEDLAAREYDKLCDKIENMISDSHKSRGKKELKLQRSSFREIRNYFEEGEQPCSVVKFGRESLVLDSWSKRCQYNAFCDILGSGINLHLAQNEIFREMFDLGEVIKQTGDKHPKRSKEYQHAKSMAEKMHTKKMRSLRDKRTVVPD